MTRPALLVFALLAALGLAGCPPAQGTLLADLCTPAEADDPFEGGTYLRVTSRGDVSRSLVFTLDDAASFDEADAYPLGARIALEFEVLNAGDVAIARGRSEEVTVQDLTQVCACLARVDQSDRCRDLGCLYDADGDRCIFFDRPQ
jgi:hypothetical protein